MSLFYMVLFMGGKGNGSRGRRPGRWPHYHSGGVQSQSTPGIRWPKLPAKLADVQRQ